MSGLNVSLGYFLVVVVLSEVAAFLLRLGPVWGFSAELPVSFMLVACWSELGTLKDVGLWAGGFGPDVTLTLLFLVLMTHSIISRGASGNPAMTLRGFLLSDTSALSTLSCLAGQFTGAYLGRFFATYYWSLELTDMHMIQNMMSSECSPSLRVSLSQGAFTEGICTLTFHLLAMRLSGSPVLCRVPLTALAITALSYAAGGYTSGYFNPALAYALTFNCPGFTLIEYAAVYWLGPLAGMTLALFLYTGHIPRLFARNLLYSQKSRYRVPVGKSSPDQMGRTGTKQGGKKGD
ncbi:aquaporin 12 [Amia ocellicauda]|uniref:aquaporin 12 n=1 Tax=Amia ocellicauda TaxID=2972642 RepID=UPI003464B5FC